MTDQVQGHQPEIQLHTLKGTLPVYNVKSTVVPCAGTDYVFLYGGFDDMDNLDSNVYLLNLKTKEWEVDDKHKQLYREGHLATYIGNGNILVIGGVPYDEVPETPRTRSRVSQGRDLQKDSFMLIYNIFSKKWEEPALTAECDAPSGRSRHASCLSPDGTKLYISGGLVNSMPLDDLYCYDLVSARWSGSVKFAARFDHHIAVHGNKLYTFGGLDKEMNHVKNTVAYYNFDDDTGGEVTLYDSLTNNKFFETFEDFESTNEKNEACDDDGISPTSLETIFLDLNSSSTKIEVALPMATVSAKNLNISSFNIDKFQRINLLDQEVIESYFLRVHHLSIEEMKWKEAFVTEDGTLYILGLNQLHEEHPSSTLSTLFEFNLSEMGIALKNSEIKSINMDTLALNLRDFLVDQQYSDFEIFAFKDESFKESYDLETMTHDYQDERVYQGIKVHKAILLARWPHFKRMIDSGMSENHSNLMFIPEPIVWVRALIYYLYTASVDFEEFSGKNISIIDYSGMLILSNLYELPDLRHKLLNKLFEGMNAFISGKQSMTPGTMLLLWKNFIISNEWVFISKILDLIKYNWHHVIRSKEFSDLPKDLIIKLCQECSDRSSWEIEEPSNSPTLSSVSSMYDMSLLDSSPSKRIRTISPFLACDQDGIQISPEFEECFPQLQYIPDSYT